jgi:hypothetical protein
MGSVVNPMFAGMVPGGMNPTGNQLSLLDLVNRGSKDSNSLLPSTNLSTSSSGSSNPYDISTSTSTSAAPNFPANASPYPSTGAALLPGTQTSPMDQTGRADVVNLFGMEKMTGKDFTRLFKDLKKTYGDGMAHLILDFLSTGAGFNQQAINNLLASLQPGISRGEEDLMSQFSASGNRFGSGAQIGLGDFLSKVNLNEGELITTMYEDALNNFINVMLGTSSKAADAKAASPSGLDSILSGIGLAGSAAGGASSIISAIAPAADTGVLDAIAGAAAFCWVASELYGGMEAPETIAIRGWLLRTWYMKPFVSLYRKFGRQWAGLIRRNSGARKFTKKLFDSFLNKSREDFKR